ncbi:MAG: oligosaccharide flippase family protein [Clostridia bacterium]|nr:oligosaccharide flippase family protein [Clostridia bacterium]
MRDQKRAGTLLSYVQLLLNVGIGIVYTPIMLHYLGQSEYGVYSVATAVIAFLTMLDLGFGQTLVRFYVKYRAEGKGDTADRCAGSFLLMYLVLGLAALAIGLALAKGFLPLLFGQKFTPGELDTLKNVLSVLVINLSLSLPLSVFSSLITAHERFAFAKGANIVSTLLTYGGILLVLLMGHKSLAMAVVTTAVSVAVKAFLAWYCVCRMKVRLTFGRPDPQMLKNIFAFSFFIFLNILLDQLYASTDKFLLGALCGTGAVTVYTVGVQFNGSFQQLSTAISGVFLPQVTRMYAEGARGEDFSPLFLRIGRLQYVLLSFVLTGFLAFGRQFIGLLTAGSLSEPEITRAFVIAAIIMVPGIVPLSQNVGMTITQAMNRHRFRSVSYLVLAILNVMISIPLCMRWEGVGAAVGTTLALFAGQYAMMNWYYWKKIGLDIPAYWKMAGSVTLRMIPMAVPALLLNLLLPAGGWLVLAAKIGLFSLLYLPYSWHFILGDYEKGIARSLLKKFC